MEENNLFLNANFVYKHSFKNAFMVNENKIKYICMLLLRTIFPFHSLKCQKMSIYRAKTFKNVLLNTEFLLFISQL